MEHGLSIEDDGFHQVFSIRLFIQQIFLEPNFQ